LSIDFDPIIENIVDYGKYPVIKLANGLYSAVMNIYDSGQNSKSIGYGDTPSTTVITIQGTVTQWHYDESTYQWVSGAPEYHELG